MNVLKEIESVANFQRYEGVDNYYEYMMDDKLLFRVIYFEKNNKVRITDASGKTWEEESAEEGDQLRAFISRALSHFNDNVV